MNRLNPLPVLLLATITGILIGYNTEVSPIVLGASTILLAVGAGVAFFRRKQQLAILCLALLFVPLGIWNTNSQLHRPLESNHLARYANGSAPYTVIGFVAKMPEFSQNRTEIVVSSCRMIRNGTVFPVTGKVLVNLQGNENVAYGNLVRFTARLTTPRSFKNFGGFDYERYLLLEDIAVRGNVGENPTGFVNLRKSAENSLVATAENFRQQIREEVKSKSEAPQREIICALILGIKKGIPTEIREDFVVTGTAHIIAISGFHIGIVAGMFHLLLFGISRFLPLGLLARLNRVKISVVLATIPVILFCFIAGATPSVVRSTVMVVAFMLALVWRRHINVYSAIFFAALVMLACSPFSLFDVSFQLSFCAVLSIVFIGKGIAACLPPDNPETIGKSYLKKLSRAMTLSAIATIAATLGTLPLIAIYFNRISIVGIPANIVMVPLMGFLVIPLCVAIPFVLPLSSSLVGLLIEAADFFTFLSLKINHFFASLPYASIYFPPPSLGETIVYYLLVVVGVLYLLKTKRKKTLVLAAAISVLLLVVIAGVFLRPYANGQNNELTVDILDVGSGNSALLQLPGGKTILLDGGGTFDNRFDMGKMVIAPQLWGKRVTRIDHVILSHPHPDHLNGLVFITKAFEIGEVWKGADYAKTDSYGEFIRTIQSKKIPVRLFPFPNGYRQEVNGVVIELFGTRNHNIGEREWVPSNTARRGANDANANSLVIKVTLGNTSILFPADISQDEESELVARYKDRLSSDILLVPHHGSKYSSSEAFIKAVSPRAAIVSCAANSIFGHPSPVILERYAKHRVKVWRTDIDGQISLKTDGKAVEIRTFTDRRWSRL